MKNKLVFPATRISVRYKNDSESENKIPEINASFNNFFLYFLSNLKSQSTKITEKSSSIIEGNGNTPSMIIMGKGANKAMRGIKKIALILSKLHIVL